MTYLTMNKLNKKGSLIFQVEVINKQEERTQWFDQETNHAASRLKSGSPVQF